MTTCITKSLSHLCHLREIMGLLKVDKNPGAGRFSSTCYCMSCHKSVVNSLKGFVQGCQLSSCRLNYQFYSSD